MIRWVGSCSLWVIHTKKVENNFVYYNCNNWSSLGIGCFISFCLRLLRSSSLFLCSLIQSHIHNLSLSQVLDWKLWLICTVFFCKAFLFWKEIIIFSMLYFSSSYMKTWKSSSEENIHFNIYGSFVISSSSAFCVTEIEKVFCI